MPEKKLQDLLQTIVRDDLEVEPRYYITSVCTFEEADVPTQDWGLLVAMSMAPSTESRSQEPVRALRGLRYFYVS